MTDATSTGIIDIPPPCFLIDLIHQYHVQQEELFQTTIETICQEMLKHAQLGRTSYTHSLHKQGTIFLDVCKAFVHQNYHLEVLTQSNVYVSWNAKQPVLDLADALYEEQNKKWEKTLREPLRYALPNCILPSRELLKISLDKDSRRDRVKQTTIRILVDKIICAAKQGKTQLEMSFFDEEVYVAKEIEREFLDRGYKCHTYQSEKQEREQRMGTCLYKIAKFFIGWDAATPLDIPWHEK